ncbi:MAG: type VI secretion system tip protein VgrG [Blastocatellia bacterium]|nr:type VI secretion system tip protein VgrG [Blastocatellia bacterium]
MPTTQEGRQLYLKTPLADDFLMIKRLRAAEGLSQLFRYDIEALHEEDEAGDEPTLVDPQQILGQKMCVTVRQDDGAERFFNGICVEFDQGNRNDRFSKYHIQLVPQVWLLTQNSQSRIFQNISIPEILQKVFEGFEVDFEIQGDFAPRNYCVQYRESDWDFASRLMEEEGIFYYFAHTADSHRMVVANTDRSHRDCPTKAQIPFRRDISVDMEEWAGSINTWIVSNKVRSGKFTLRDHHFQLPTNDLEGSEVSRFNIGGNQDLEIYDYPGRYAARFDGIDGGGGEQPSALQKIFDDRARTVSIRQQELDVQYKGSKGTGDSCALTAGCKFELTSHPDAANNRSHVLVTVRVEAVQTPSYLSNEPVDSAYQASFLTIPQGQGQAPFRPTQRTRKPVVHGSQTAVVVGPAGEEIFVDKYGRVKVQFHWDREGRRDASSSCWIRVGTSIAGNKWGTMFIPRIGQEVIVDFMEGDPDQPIIVGSVYNAERMPHYDLPKYKTMTYIKTRTSPDDGKGFNELRFEDKAGKEQVFVRSQKRYDLRVRGSMYETCGGNRQEVIGVRSDDNPGGNLAITVGGNKDVHIKDSHYVGIDGKLNESVKGDVVEDYQGNLSTIVKAKTELNAREITLEALTKISLKVGGNCIMIDPSGITIAGTITKINSGGFATGTGNPAFDDALDAETADTGEPGYLDRPRRGGGGGRRRRNLQSQHYVAPPRPGEDPRITAMRGTLANSEQGRHALEVYDRYGVNSTFNGGNGSTYDGGTNTMNLDPTEDPTTSALTFVHEMNHAEEGNEGTSGDITNMDRQEYVDEMLQEEIDGTVDSIEARNELAEGGTDVSNAHFPLENEYQAAHDQAVADARAANPNISDADAEAAGRAAGRQAVADGFNNGSVVTSNTNESYPDYYGDAWDDAHPSGGGTP